MLVVVHHGDVERALQALFDVETFRSLYVFKVDAAERGGYLLYSLAELFGVFFVNLNVEHVDAAINLKQESLALHDGLAAHGSDVAQTEHGGAVAYHGNQVALSCVFIRVIGSFLYLKARKRNARRIGQTKVGLRTVGFCRFNFYFTGFPVLVICKSGLFCYVYHRRFLLSYFVLSFTL